MIIDYNNQAQMNDLAIKVNKSRGQATVSINGDFCGVTFRNFPSIVTDDSNFTNCVFENIQSIEFSQGKISNCTFRNVSEVCGQYVDFRYCTFTQCRSQGPLLTIDSDGSVNGCTFDTITALGDDGYVIYSVYGKKKDVKDVKNCRFINCKVESTDGLFTCGAYFTRFSSYKTRKIENIDMHSCDFGGGSPVVIGSFETENEDNAV